jgi:hypothetical protein
VRTNRLSILLAIALFATSVTSLPAQAAGRTTGSIPNTILNGKGSPKSSLGINGDFYIDVRSLLLFGPKANGKWPAPQNLQGPTGATGLSGSDGKNGNDGKTISNASASSGPAGPAGPTGPAGPAGATGPAGPSGSGGGGSGPAGATGAQGPQGIQGVQGETGTAGARGETGTAGERGPSGVIKLINGTMTFPGDISGPIGASQVASINGFKAGKSYVLRVKIIGIKPSSLIDPEPSAISLSVSGISGVPEVVTQYSITRGLVYRGGRLAFEQAIDADISLNGLDVTTDYGAAFTVIAGETAGAVRLSATFMAMEVGSVSSTF